LQGGDASAAACVNNNGCGIVYKLTPKTVGAAVVWSETVLYTFEGGADGNRPATPLTIDGKGNLYGTTLAGGVLAGTNVPPCGTYGAGNANDYGCGIVFELSKGASAPWAEHVLYAFTGGADGAQPKAQVTFSAGNLYGTAYAGGNLDATTYPNCSADMKGGAPGCGVAFELKKPKTADTFPWTYVNLYTFKGGADGNGPMSPLLPIAAGKLFGATIAGGVLNNTGCNNGDGFTNAPGCGALFELKP
jgi:hypothetical protein